MCEPATLAAITLAISAASAAASYAGQRQQAKAQEQSAQDAYLAEQGALDQQQLQVNEKASQQMGARAVEAMRERGRLRTISSEVGGGNSMDRLEGEVNLAEAGDMAAIERNRAMQEGQAQLQKRGIRAQAQSQINLSKRPSEAALGLQLASSSLSAYNGYKQSLKITG